MRKTAVTFGTCLVAGLMVCRWAFALNVLPTFSDSSFWGSFADNRAGKKTQISYEKTVDEKQGEVLKIKYILDSDSWCGVYRHSVNQNWFGIKTLDITIRGTEDAVVRVSFLDANKVSYVNDVTITSDWNKYSLPIDDFKKNPYYQPPDAKVDKPMNIKTVRQIQFEPQTSGNGIIYLAKLEAAGVPDVFDNGAGEKSTAPPTVFETFENKKLAGNFKYANDKGGAAIVTSVKRRESPKNPKNKYFFQATYSPGKGDYGCGFGFGSNYAAASETASASGAPFNAKGRSTIQFMAKVPSNAKFRVSLSETDKNDGEKWTSPWQTGNGPWAKYTIALRSFEKNPYVGNQEGNDIFNLESIKAFEIEIGPNQAGGVIEVDDVIFK